MRKDKQIKKLKTNHKSANSGLSSLDSLHSNNDYEVDGNRVNDEINRGKLSTAPIHTELKILRWSKKDKADAKAKGYIVKTGRFTKEEDIILTNNWLQFCDDFPVDNPHMFLGYYGYNKGTDSAERNAVKEMVRRGEMYMRLAKGLPQRPLYKIYQRARKLFSGLNKSVNLTEEERQEIIELGQKGYKSCEIAAKFTADIKTVTEIIRRNLNPKTNTFLKKNKWSPKENRKMKRIIRRIIAENNITDISEIPWSDVSLHMGKRSDHQCREHFFTTTFFQIYDSEGQLKKWDFSATQKLVYFLYKMNSNSELEIDWDDVKDKFTE